MTTDTGRRHELIAEEQRLWDELWSLTESLADEEAAEPGYFEDGWSAKDVLAHVGSWLAEAGIALEQLRMGTYELANPDVDALNQQCRVGMHDVPFDVVRAQAAASRARMRQEWATLEEPVSAEADRWVRKAGPEHYAEHLPRLRAWVKELHARR